MKTYTLTLALLFLLSATLSAYGYLLFHRPQLAVEDQPVGTTLFVRRLVLGKSGFIVLRPEGTAEPAISDYMPANVYADFNIDILTGQLNAKPGARVAVEIWEDNGDAAFNDDLDAPMKGKDGNAFIKIITLR